jgi:hypothetical protein
MRRRSLNAYDLPESAGTQEPFTSTSSLTELWAEFVAQMLLPSQTMPTGPLNPYAPPESVCTPSAMMGDEDDEGLPVPTPFVAVTVKV